ncbi:MAG: ThuA domain-containing protein [Planctomycetes bacterium]|nr:ThuA domain-containing protein [Planctomycetota bacterium]
MKRAFCFLMFLLPSLAFGQGFTPEEAVKRMTVPDGFTVKIAACEPMIRQPLSVSFDERGRMWVLQYLQYPNPAGLKALKQDQYLRTIWDRVPEPPPKGTKGVDRLTICYDPDANGRFQKSKDFLKDLNLASGFCLGNGGVYVLQSPYLLFYADKNKDDIPDGDPDVLLTGFGFDDTHSVANSLQWGPDGWLYGAAGSTSTCKIKNPAYKKPVIANSGPPEVIEFQQGIWRYHPRTKQFELFSEGGGNTFGLDFDKNGQVIAGTNYGSRAMLHQVQGAYYVKGFSKHGPLHNPHTYGYFEHVPYTKFKGGHVTCGGVVYQADAYPKEYHDQYIAGNLLSSALYWHKMTPKGSSFTAEHGGDFLVANDPWFRPIDCFQGPDGSVYVVDWYDKRAAHLDPIDSWDKTNGRIYKVEYKGTKAVESFDLSKKTARELVELLKHPNKWWRNEARRLLTEKPLGINQETFNALRSMFENEKGHPALEAFWTLYLTGGMSEALIERALKHPNEHVRSWAVRVIGDERKISDTDWHRLMELAKTDDSPIVRSQLACTAKRLPGEDSLALMLELFYRSEDAKDPHIPLLLWWAVEDKAISHQPHLIHLLFGDMGVRRGFWQSPMVRDVLLERLARRYIAENSDDGYKGAADLLKNLPDPFERSLVINGMAKGLEGRRLNSVPAVLIKPLAERAAEQAKNPEFERLMIRLGDEAAYLNALKNAENASLSDTERLKKMELVAELRKADALPLFLDVFQTGKTDALRLGALTALQGYSDPKVSATLLATFPKLAGKLRQQAQTALLSRAESALALLQLVEKKAVEPKEIPIEQLRPVVAFNDPAITKIVEKNWGKIGAATPGEKQARISWLNATLGRGPGDAVRGKLLYTKSCAVCHTLFNEGGKVGPDLTTADRKNRAYILAQIIDPSAHIRQEFLSYSITLLDGRKVTGLVGESTAESLTVLNVVNDQVQKTPIAKASIEEMIPSSTSLMPEKILDPFQDQDVRDLFAFMQMEVPAKKKAEPGPKKLKVLLISGSLEYKSDDSLAAFQKYLEANYPVECSRAFRKADDDIPGLEGLETCDVAVFFTRRLTVKGEQLERIKKYATSGKPIVAIRTASHGFQNWLAMDKEVLGGNYKNHYKDGPKCEIKIADKGKEHPILQGVKPWASTGSLYLNPDINKDVTLLMTGSIPDHTEPITWVRENKGGRVFYTSLGHPDDFKEDSFKRMLVNAIFWTAKRDVPVK